MVYFWMLSVSEIALIGPLLGKMFFGELQQSVLLALGSLCCEHGSSVDTFLYHTPEVNCICTLKDNKNLFLHPQWMKHVMSLLPWTEHMLMQIVPLHFRICRPSMCCLWERSQQHLRPSLRRESQISFWMAGEGHRSVIVCSDSKCKIL